MLLGIFTAQAGLRSSTQQRRFARRVAIALTNLCQRPRQRPKASAPKNEVRLHFQADLPCPVPPLKILLFLFFRIHDVIAASRPDRGALRERHETLVRDAMAGLRRSVLMHADERREPDGEVAWS